MEAFQNLFMGFGIALSYYNLLVALIGLILGIVIGVLPGLGGANGVAILIPFTFIMPPSSAIILLTSIYWGALFGGVITSILFNIPGEPWSVATTFDGYPMAKQGRAGEALTAAFTSHFIGGAFGIILVSFFAPIIADFSLRFGPPEYFSIMMLTFSAFVALGGASPAKTVAAIMLGFMMAAVGLDIVSGKLRMTFGTVQLMGGFTFIVAVIGLFGIGEIFLTVEEGLKLHGAKATISLRVIGRTWKQMGQYWRAGLRGAAIGAWMGIKPGGATPASFMSYGFAKQFSKKPDEFGKGTLEGVIAPETAAHAAGVTATLPTITLGIPGSPTMAVILGGLMIWGLQPGPMLFKEHPNFVWGLIASMYTAQVIGVVIALLLVPLWASILRVPFSILFPGIIFACAVGAYAVNTNMRDVWYMMMFGGIGYVFKKLDYPIAPMVLALVLGDMAETAMRQSLIISGGNPIIFFTSPISGVIMTGALVIFFWPLIQARRRRPKIIP